MMLIKFNTQGFQRSTSLLYHLAQLDFLNCGFLIGRKEIVIQKKSKHDEGSSFEQKSSKKIFWLSFDLRPFFPDRIIRQRPLDSNSEVISCSVPIMISASNPTPKSGIICRHTLSFNGSQLNALKDFWMRRWSKYFALELKRFISMNVSDVPCIKVSKLS